MISIDSDNKSVNLFKLFSNPVSGIVSTIYIARYDFDYTAIKDEIKNIRYTRSMMLKALKFWRDKYSDYYEKIKRLDSPVFGHNPSENVVYNLNNIHNMIQQVQRYGKGFLYTHSNILTRSSKTIGELQQTRLIVKKLGLKDNYSVTYFGCEPCIRLSCGFIKFVAFPNIHPYIPRRRIKSVGVTQKGNVYLINEKPITH